MTDIHPARKYVVVCRKIDGKPNLPPCTVMARGSFEAAQIFAEYATGGQMRDISPVQGETYGLILEISSGLNPYRIGAVVEVLSLTDAAWNAPIEAWSTPR